MFSIGSAYVAAKAAGYSIKRGFAIGQFRCQQVVAVDKPTLLSGPAIAFGFWVGCWVLALSN